MIQRTVVERRGWISDAEFTRYWAICQISPGINLLGLTVLIGWRLRRAPGAVICLFGLLLPSVSITALLTAVYASIRAEPAVVAALHGVVPATVGLGALLAWQMGRPLIAQSWVAGPPHVLASLLLLLGSAATVLLWHPPVIVVLLGAGAVGAMWEMWAQRAA